MKRNRILVVVLLAAGLTADAQTSATFKAPLMGWSSWNTFAAKISEDIIKGQADAMVATGLDTCGYNYINIDDGFQWDRAEDGTLGINATRFPNGLKPVVDYIHAKGLKAGIYSDAGRGTCAAYYGGETHEEGTGLLGHDDQDCQLFFTGLEFDFIKVDFCGGTSWQNTEKLNLDPQERYTAIAEAIGRTGRDVDYNVCRWDFPGTWVVDIADSWRISQDINASWNSVKDIIGQNLYLSAYCGGGHYNDMDMLEVGRGLSTTEDQTHFGMWCIMSSPLLIGCDLRSISSTARSLMGNTDLIALNQDRLGLQAYVVSEQDGAYVLVKDIVERNGLTRAVALYNPTDAAKAVKLTFTDIDLDGNVTLHDCFAQRDLTNTFTESVSMTVPAHGTKIYRVTGERRLTRTVYEAETAWLGAYQELTNNQTAETAVYAAASGCSGGGKAGWLGRSAANDLQWRNVWVPEEGDYDMTISYLSGENRTINVDVNGTKAATLSCNSGGWTTVGTTTTCIHLVAGDNVVRLYNASAWMPDIDCMTLAPVATAVSFPSEAPDAGFRKGNGELVDLSGRVVSRDGLIEHAPGGIYVRDGQKMLLP